MNRMPLYDDTTWRFAKVLERTFSTQNYIIILFLRRYTILLFAKIQVWRSRQRRIFFFYFSLALHFLRFCVTRQISRSKFEFTYFFIEPEQLPLYSLKVHYCVIYIEYNSVCGHRMNSILTPDR